MKELKKEKVLMRYLKSQKELLEDVRKLTHQMLMFKIKYGIDLEIVYNKEEK